MKRMTNMQALVNCTVAMKRVPSKLEVLLWYACAGKRYCWIQGTEKGRLLRMVASFPITLAEVIIQVPNRAGRRTPRPGRVVCGARACGVKFTAETPLGWAGWDLAVLVWWFWCRRCFSEGDLSTRHAGLTQCSARFTGVLTKPDFYCRSLSNAVVTQASLHEIIFGPRVLHTKISQDIDEYKFCHMPLS
jgi:hypothetical protein